MTSELPNASGAPCVSLGIIAWNEEEAIAPLLDSLFRQSLFEQLHQHHARCEVVCVLNGCTDRTAAIASEVFCRQAREHPYGDTLACRVENLELRGKLNAWNQFVHRLSYPAARFLFLLDADILIHGRDTLWNMLAALQNDARASVAVDRPCKDIEFKQRKSVWERLSLSASDMTQTASGQLCGQLYCIRAEVARNIYLPRDLAACDDGFIKALVCTDFLEHGIVPERIRLAEQAEHTFEAYTSPAAILRNQKRQMLGQTVVHILVDRYLPSLPPSARARLAQTLREREASDPDWLKRLIREHLRTVRYFWRLYPGLLAHRFESLRNVSAGKRLACFPAALAKCLLALVSSYLAWRSLKRGCTEYWPRPKRLRLGALGPAAGELATCNVNKD